MTPEKLAELEALAEKATKGPWVRWIGHSDVYAGLVTLNARHAIADHEGCVCDCDQQDEQISESQCKRNAAFIAASREALPALIARVRELEAENAELRRET